MSNKFYENLIKGTYSQEKTASTQEEVKKALSDLTEDQIEALAEEIGVFTKVAENLTVEEKATEAAREVEQPAEKTHKENANKSVEDKVPKEDDQEEAKKTQAENTKKEEDDQENAKKEEVATPTPADKEKDDNQYAVKTAAETLHNILLEGASIEEKIASEASTMAYGMVEEFLKQANFSVKDYIMVKVANEELADVIADKAEKVASVYGVSAIQAADDIMGEIGSLLSDEE